MTNIKVKLTYEEQRILIMGLVELKNVGTNRSMCAMVAVVDGTTVVVDQCLFDVPCLMLWHVIIEMEVCFI